MNTSQMLSSAVFALVVSLHLTSVHGLSLSLDQPDPTTVRLTCKDGETTAAGATFQKNGVNITNQLSVVTSFPGFLEFTLSQSKGLGGQFTCSEDGTTSNTITLPGVIIIEELEDQTVQGGETAVFQCEALASDYQPDVVWMLDNDIYTNCPEASNYCVENHDVAIAQMTRSKFSFRSLNASKSSIHLVKCFVNQESDVSSTATLIFEKVSTVEPPNSESPSSSSNSGNMVKEAELIGGTSVGAVVVLVSTTVITTVVVMWRRYMNRKHKELLAEREEIEEREESIKSEEPEPSPDADDQKVALDMEEETPDKN